MFPDQQVPPEIGVYDVKRLKVDVSKVQLNLFVENPAISSLVNFLFAVQSASISCLWRSDQTFACTADTRQVALSVMGATGPEKDLILVGGESDEGSSVDKIVSVGFKKELGGAKGNLKQVVDVRARGVRVLPWQESIPLAGTLLPIFATFMRIIDLTGEDVIIDGLLVHVTVNDLRAILPKNVETPDSPIGFFMLAPETAKIRFDRSINNKIPEKEILTLDVKEMNLVRRDEPLGNMSRKEVASIGPTDGFMVLLEPLSVGMDFKQILVDTLLKEEKGQLIGLDLNSIGCMLSLHDFRLGLGIMREWTELLQQLQLRLDGKAPQQQETKTKEEEATTSSLPLTVDIRVRDALKLAVATDAHLMDNFVLTTGRTGITVIQRGDQLDVLVKSGQVKLVDTSANYPVHLYGNDILTVSGEDSLDLVMTSSNEERQKLRGCRRPIVKEQLLRVFADAEFNFIFVQEFVVKLMKFFVDVKEGSPARPVPTLDTPVDLLRFDCPPKIQ